MPNTFRLFKKTFITSVSSLLTLVLVFTFSTTVQALTVSPAIDELIIEPGQSHTSVIKLTNEEPRGRTFYITYQNFEPRGESGTPFFIGAEDGLATWIESQEEVFLPAGGQAEVTYTVNVPADAQPGGYFASVFFGTEPPATEDEVQVSIGGKVGVLVLLRVSGDIGEDGGIVEFGTEEGKKLFNSLPINFMYRFNNDGGDRVAPVGEIRITNLIGRTKDRFTVNDQKSNVLPGSIRKFTYLWGPEPTEPESESFIDQFLNNLSYQWENRYLGIYKANLNLAWGVDSENEDTAKFTFYVIPWQLGSLLLIGLLFLVLFLKLYKRAVVKSALEAAKQTPAVSKKSSTRKAKSKASKTTTKKLPKKPKK